MALPVDPRDPTTRAAPWNPPAAACRIVVLLDVSASMGTIEDPVEGRTRFDQMLEDARELIEDRSHEDEMMLVADMKPAEYGDNEASVCADLNQHEVRCLLILAPRMHVA